MYRKRLMCFLVGHVSVDICLRDSNFGLGQRPETEHIFLRVSPCYHDERERALL